MILLKFLLRQIFLLSLLLSGIIYAQTGPNDDFDGDGIINSVDIDDDNDGISDAVESPSCFYAINQWNTLAKPASAVTVSSGLTTTVSNFSQLLDGVNNVTAVTFSTTPAQPIQNANVYLFTFAQPARLDALYLKFNTATQFGGTTKIQGSNTNNGTDWVDLSAAVAQTAVTNTTVNGNVGVTTSIKYPVTLNTSTSYKYIRITGVTASNIAAQNASEVYFDFNLSAYVASRYPRAGCTDANIDGDGMFPHYDLDSDGDGASDAREAGATASTTPNFQFPDIDTNNDGLVDAVDANNDGIVNYVSTYNPNALNSQISPFLTEICNDGLDNDADGLIDEFDSDCSPLATCASTKTINNFEIQQQITTSSGDYNNYQTPIVADIDKDGIPDIVAFNDANNSISVLNSTTLVPKFSIPNTEGTFGPRPNSLAVGQLDGSGYLEIVYFSSNNKLVVMRYNGSAWQKFTSNAVTGVNGAFGTNSTALADFDQDGVPEIYFGNQIFSVNFNCSTQPCITRVVDGATVGTATGEGGSSVAYSFAYDVLSDSECTLCKGLELIAGNQVYAVDVATGQVQLARNFTGGPTNPDGPTAIADINLDGLLDVVVSNVNGTVYAWTPQTNTLIRTWAGNGAGQRAIPFVANVYNDDLADDGIINSSAIDYPEVIVLVNYILTAYNFSNTSSLYTLTTSDLSAATSMVAFDFNGDGNKEIVYRDQTNMRIIYGGPMAYAPPGVDAERNYAIFSCSSGTGWEHPIVADIDADGEAEIVGSCGTSISVFGSGRYPWMPARPIWNQSSYNVVNVNDDGSIPVYQQSILTSFNGPSNQILNTFNNQLNPLELISPQGQIASPDISVSNATITNPLADGSIDCSNIQIQYEIANTGSATMANNIYIYVYDKDPRTQSTASLIYQTTTTQNIPAGTSITQNLQFGIPASSFPVGNLYIAVNTNPDMTVLIDAVDFAGSYPECNYSNNIFELALAGCSDIDGDGIADALDIDDDNDGILDAVESPVCFYTAAEAVVPVKVSTGIINSTVSSVAVIVGNDIPSMHDGVTVNGTSNHVIPANQLGTTGVVIYKIQYPTAISLTQMAVSTATANWGAGSFAVLEGSNDDASYIAVSAPVATSTGATKVWPVTLNTTNLYRFYRIRVSTVGSTQPTFSNYEVVGSINQSTYIPSANPKPINCTVDTDGDGIPNHQDLDSDGDGCPDARESGVSTNAGASASMSASGGAIYTGGIPSGTANAYVGNGTPAQYGVNGFFNGIETTLDSGLYNGTYTYPFAISNAISLCADTDGDGINDFVDIDDDNDGVVDALESPSCFYTASEWNTGPKPFYGVTISSGLTTTTANFSQLIDGVSGTTAVAFSASPAQSNANADVYLFNFAQPVKLDALYLQFNTTTQFGGVTKIQGSNTNNGSDWVDLSASIGAVPATNITANGAVSVTSSIKYPVTLNTATAYKYIRITGGATASNMIAANASEVYFDFNNASYIASSYPKTTCASDTDGDGILNHLDLDSDGDGCSDAMEGGATSNLTANYKFTGPVGTNGLDNSLETADNGIVTYVSTYNMYAIEASIKACTDTDGDGIVDVIDIDDDNDGVLDIVESPPCAIVDRDDTSNRLAWDFEQTLHTLPTTEYNAAQTQPYNVRTFGPGVVDVSGANVLKFTGATAANFDDAVANGDYMQYYFTTTSTYLSIDKIYNFTIQSPLKQGVIISTDPSFATYTVLNTGAATITGSNVYNTMDTYSNYPLNLNTRYYVRFVYYGLTGTTASYVDAVGLSFNGISNAESCLNGLDIDNDGIPNRLDLDSDGDGCPDAVEAGTATQAGAGNTSTGTLVNTGGTQTGVANAIVGNNTPAAYGSNGFYSGIETNDTSSAAYTGIYSYNQYAIVSTLNLCTDTDGDGIIDLNDIDDDNDGIVDAVESPACFYTAAEANTITNVTSPLNAAAGDPTVNTEIATLHNGNASDANPYNFVSQSVASGATIFTVTYPTPVTLSSITVTQIASGMSINGNAFGKLYGSVDGVSYILLTSGNGIALNTATVTFANAVTTPYRYYQIRSVGTVAAGNTAAFNTGTAGIQEISSVIAVTPVYLASAHPKPGICSVDTDGDTIPNHLDLDSDGDGCSDLAESGVSPATDIITPLMTNNAGGSYGIANPNGSQLNPTAADVNNDGLNDSVDADLNSITNYTSTYSNAINAAIASCTLFCYRPAVLSGTVLSTPQGITSLHRAGVDADNWPMVRKGAWTALEAKTKGFVPNRLTIAQINLIPAGDLREGMMVYNISSDCLYINTDGTPTGWKCFNTQACPD